MLGREECRDTGNHMAGFECSECGEYHEMHRSPGYRPSCGRKVAR